MLEAASTHDTAAVFFLVMLELAGRGRSSACQRKPVTGFELLGADSKISTLNKIRRALEGAGVEFIDGSIEDDRGPGVRLRHSDKPAGKRK